MNRIDRGFHYAIQAARSSTCRYKVGAALFINGKLISLGTNSKKTHPLSETIFNWSHAEMDCLAGLQRRDLLKSTLFVARVTQTGTLRISKPCKVCQKVIKSFGVKKVWFINQAGEREMLW